MNHRRDAEQFGRHHQEPQDEDYGGDRDAMRGGRGADDWRSDAMRSGWGRDGGGTEFGMRAAQQGLGAFANEGGGVPVSHRGKGPKGFTRSDERIQELVSEALSDSYDVDASDIEVTVTDGEVTLAGTVSDRRMKRLAEDVVEDIAGVHDIHNQLRIGRERTAITDTVKQNAPSTRGQH